MRRSWFCCLVVTACCAVAQARVALAQETIHFASVSGRVSDGQGAVVPGAQVSARQRETNVTADTITNAEGRFRFPYLKVETCEMKVHVEGFADYINIVTKSGTNTWRGTSYDFVRDDNFNAPNALSGTTLPMHQQQYCGSVGGPVARDRTFFFSNVERRLLDQTGLVTILPENVSVINARLAAVDYPGSLITTGVYPNPVHSANVLGKLDHHASGSDHLTVRLQGTASRPLANGVMASPNFDVPGVHVQPDHSGRRSENVSVRRAIDVLMHSTTSQRGPVA
jgi:hypothetical protein